MKTPLILQDDIISRNVEINGGMNFWQRGTSWTPMVNNTYGPDKYRHIQNGTMAMNMTRSTDVPSDSPCQYSTRIQCATAQAVLGASDRVNFVHVVEGNLLRQFKTGRPFTRSFAVKSNKPGTYSVSIANTGYGYSVVGSFTINNADTWERKSITFPALPIALGTWDFGTGVGLTLIFNLAGGSSLATSNLLTWQPTWYQCATGQANLADTVGNYIQFTEIGLYVGSEARKFDFVGRNFLDEFAMCQRYLEKQYEIDVVPGTPVSSTMLARPSPNNNIYGQERFRTIKRAYPTMTLYDYNGGSGGPSATASFSAPGWNSGSNPVYIQSYTTELFNFYCAAGYQEYWKYIAFGWVADSDFYT